VTARGTDEYSSANLRVEKDRTLQVLVEGTVSVLCRTSFTGSRQLMSMPIQPEPLYESISKSPPRLMTPVSVGMASQSPHPFTSHKRKHDDMSRLSEPRETISVPYSSPRSQYMQISPPQSRQSPHPLSATEDVASPAKKQKVIPMNVTSPGSVSEHESGGDWGELPISTSQPSVSDEGVPAPQPTSASATFEPENSNSEVKTPSVPNGVPSPQLDPQLDRSNSSSSYRGLVTGSESHKHTEADQAVIRWLKSFITQEQGWHDFVESRRTTLTVGEQLKHYRYIESQFNRFVGRQTPPDLEGGPSCWITRVRILRSTYSKPD
jgi:hypothetical protein